MTSVTLTFVPVRRFISSLLAILVLLLSCLPCNDAAADTCAATSHEQTVMQSAGGDNSPAHDGDHCSPFCTCSCCAGVMLPIALSYKVSEPFDYAGSRPSVHRPQAIAGISIPVWQPPQLV